jgi:Protein of unknown function (DUF3072)
MSSLPPTDKQLAYLRRLAQRTGRTFATPRTRSEASAEIRQLRQARGSGFTFAELEAEEAGRRAHDDAPLVRSFEVAGYGASATWSQRA